jgi:hypothetical protein
MLLTYFDDLGVLPMVFVLGWWDRPVFTDITE